MTNECSADSEPTGCAALEVDKLTKHFGGLAAVQDVTLSFPAGRIVALLGDNGAGKSTLVKMISGAVQPTRGRILINGASIKLQASATARACGIETVYQDLALCPDLNAYQNLFLGREIVKRRAGVPSLDRNTMRERCLNALENFGTRLPLDVPVSRLSGGQRQAIAIARAAQWGTRLVIFDEPTAALGVVQSQRTLELVKNVALRGAAVILISHNLDEAFAVADRFAVLRLGRLVGNFPRAAITKAEMYSLIAGDGN